MKLHEAIILILSCGSLIGLLAWLFIKQLRTVWPEGKRFVAKLPTTPRGTQPMTLTLVYSKKLSEAAMKDAVQLTNSALIAVWATAVAWIDARKAKHVSDDESPTRDVVVYIESAEVMAEQAKRYGLKGLAGYIWHWQTRGWFGRTLPMAVISELNIAEVIKTGEPVIHELCHALERDFVADKNDHTDPDVWIAAAKEAGSNIPSVQEVARTTYLTTGMTMRIVDYVVHK